MELLSLTSLHSWLAVIALASFTYLSWQKTIYGVYLIALFLPTYLIRFTIGGLPTTILELAIIMLFTTWLIKDKQWKQIRWQFWRKEKHTNPIPNALRLPLILFAISGLIAMLISANTGPAFGIFKAYILEPLLFLIVFSYTAQTRIHALNVIKLLGLTTIVLGLIAAWQSIAGLGMPGIELVNIRATSLFSYPNASSLLIAPVVALNIGLLLTKQKSIELIYSVAVITLGMIAILAAQTTGALIAVLAVVWIVFVRFQKTRSMALAIAIIILSIGFGSPTYQDQHVQTAKNIWTNHLDLQSTSFEIRVNQWRETLNMLIDHPIKGGGLANYQQALSPYHQYDFLEIYLYPHNILLNFWTELGLLGLIAILWLFTAIFKILNAAQKRTPKSFPSRQLSYSVMLAWIALIIHGLVDVPYFKNDLSVLFMILIGLTILVYNLPRRKKYS